MTTAIHALQGAESLLLALARLWATVGSSVEAASLLWLLNQLANLIRLAYQAGRAVGTVYWCWLHPLVIAAWAGIRWTWSQIDWRFVGAVVLDGLKVLTAFAITAARAAQPALIKASECLGHWYSRLLVEPAAAPLVAPAINPLMATICWRWTMEGFSTASGSWRRSLQDCLLAMAEELEQLTCNQLRLLTGTRSKLAKRQLVAIAVAC